MFKKLTLAATMGLGLCAAPLAMADSDRHQGRDGAGWTQLHGQTSASQTVRSDDHHRHRDNSSVLRERVTVRNTVTVRHGLQANQHRDDAYRGHDSHRRRGDDRDHHHRYSHDRDRHHDYGRDYHHDDRASWWGHRKHDHDRHHWYSRERAVAYPHWRRGDRLPSAYCDSRYVVRDYHAHRLYAPSHGHHWVRVNNDAVLAAVATGIVAAVVVNAF